MRFQTLLLALVLASTTWAQGTQYPPQNMMVPGPARAKDFRSWRADLQHWRRESLIRLGYDGSQYERPDLKWTQRSFIQPRMTIHDLDPVAGKHTVDRYLYDLDKRLGGLTPFWCGTATPNMGIDNRNQYDLLPGNGWGAWPIWLSDKGGASHWNAKATKP